MCQNYVKFSISITIYSNGYILRKMLYLYENINENFVILKVQNGRREEVLEQWKRSNNFKRIKQGVVWDENLMYGFVEWQ